MELEQQLRGALKAEDPGPDFTAAVLRKLDRTPATIAAPRPRWRLPASLAAALLLAMAGLHWQSERQVRQRNLLAGQQLAIALEIASSQLNAVQLELAPKKKQENGS